MRGERRGEKWVWRDKRVRERERERERSRGENNKYTFLFWNKIIIVSLKW